MKTMIQKARSGFTLVELLVVMLILTILSVSLLPMFKESICRAQYAADAIPVIGTLRTRIGLYQYEHAKLPDNVDPDAANNQQGGQQQQQQQAKFYVSSWDFVYGTTQNAQGQNSDDSEKYQTAYYEMGDSGLTVQVDGSNQNKLISTGKTLFDSSTITGTSGLHFGYPSVLDVDYQDLRGRSSRPIDYVYYQIPVVDATGKQIQTDSAYVIGCFGAGYGGLASGTGYAVCEINLVSKEKKYIGIFERYKAKKHDDPDTTNNANATASTLPYLVLNGDTDGDTTHCKISGDFVWVPQQIGTAFADDTTSADNRPTVISYMEQAGWKF